MPDSRAHRPGRVFYSIPRQDTSRDWDLFGADIARGQQLRDELSAASSAQYRELLTPMRVNQAMLAAARRQELTAVGYMLLVHSDVWDNLRQSSVWQECNDDVSANPEVADHAKILVDLAKHGREQDFRDLGAMLGVAKDRLDDLWSGTVARLKP